MDAPPSPRRSAADATLGAFEPPLRDALVPLLLYKSVFLGDWFEALARQEREEAVRRALLDVSRDTLREAIEAVDTFRPWQAVPHDADAIDRVVQVLQRRILHDLLQMKEGNNEAMLYVAMHAPTDEVRRKLVRLTDRDRVHANILRGLLGTAPVGHGRERGDNDADEGGSLGAREARSREGTLTGSLRADLARIEARGTAVARLVLSPAALRHLRDEGAVGSDGVALGLPVDVDFGWSGECHAFVTDERVRLSELLSRELRDPHP